MKVGALTIGQSPRLDVEPDFLAAACPGVELLQRGALDGLSPEDLAGLRPRPGEYLLVTRLRDGMEVRLAEERIVECMRGCVRDLESDGVELIALFCTGEFPGLESRVPLLKPDRLIAKFMAAVSPGAAICAIVPSAAQIPAMKAKWEKEGFAVEAVTLSPYTCTEVELRGAARKAAESRGSIIVLDCIGYSRQMKAVFREVCRRPVILPRTLLGRAVAEFVDALP